MPSQVFIISLIISVILILIIRTKGDRLLALSLEEQGKYKYIIKFNFIDGTDLDITLYQLCKHRYYLKKKLEKMEE